MSNTAVLIWKGVGVSIMFALLLAAVIWGYRMQPTNEACRALIYTVVDSDERSYVTERELTQLLKAADLFPVGRTLDVGSLHRIESAVRKHPMVRTAECYLTPRNEVRIRVTQRVPLLRVQTPVETYLIDTDRRVMEARACVRDKVPVVTGNIGVQMAASQMAEFALWLQDNDYWRTRVHHLHVQSPQMVYIYLTFDSGDLKFGRVVLGPMRGYERKLAKLRTFLARGQAATKDKQYTEIDVRFKGQVIGRY